jgi:hypothetical protein
MIDLAHVLSGHFLLAGSGLLAGSAITGITFRLLRARLKALAPQWRTRALLGMLLFSPLTAATLVFAMSAPWLPFGTDPLAHCANHPSAHPALCGWHPPQLHLDAWLIGAIGLGALLGAATLAVMMARAVAIRSRFHLIHRIASPHRREGYLALPLARPMAFVAGILRPQVYISAGLERQLTAEQKRIVLAHEHAHLRRGDLLMTGIVNALSRLQWPRVGRALRADWRLASEQQCDEAAAVEVGDRVGVADCLVHVARLHCGRDGFGAMTRGMLDCDLSARVTALLEPPRETGSGVLAGLGALQAGVAMSLLVLGAYFHHWIEVTAVAAG